jgi:hypothetical protein
MLPKAVCSERPTHLNCCPKHIHTHTEEEEEAQKLKNFFLEELHKEVFICFQLSFQGTHKKKKKKKTRRSEA